MKTILIIEDHDGFRGLLEKTLSLAGYSVITAPDGKIGLELYYDWDPDVVITDIYMPNKDGLEVIAEISTSGHGSKVIAISGMCDISDSCLKMAKKMSAVHTFCKPFHMEELLAAIEAIVHQDEPPRA